MARLTIPDETPSATFTVTTPTSAFAISFAVLSGKADLRVTVDDVELEQADFTFSGTLLDDGGYDGGTVTMNDAVDDCEVVIWRDIAIQRTSNYAPSNSVPVRTIDGALNRIVAHLQDLKHRFVTGVNGAVTAAAAAEAVLAEVQAAALYRDAVDVRAGGAVAGSYLAGKIEAAFTLAGIQGLPVRFPAAEDPWITEAIDAGTVPVLIDPGATVQLRSGAALVEASKLFVFRYQDDGAYLLNLGTIDFNRDGQDRLAYNAANGSVGRNYAAVMVRGISGDPLLNVEVHAGRVINAPDFALSLWYCTRPKFSVNAKDCGGSGEARYCTDQRGAAFGDDLDNDGWKTFPHGLDLFSCSGGEVIVGLRNHSGYNAPSVDSLSWSEWFSGLTAIDCDGLRIVGDSLAAKADDDMVMSVGLTILGMRRCRVEITLVERYTDTLFENEGNVDCQFGPMIVDGHYQRATLSASSANGFGVTAFNGGYYPDTRSRAISSNVRLSFNQVKVRRCLGPAWRLGAAIGCSFVDCEGTGSRYGLWSQYNMASSDTFPSQVAQPLRDNRIIGGDFSGNEIDNLLLADGDRWNVSGPNLDNAGQAITSGGARRDAAAVTSGRGLNASGPTSGLTKTGNQYLDIAPADTQTKTSIKVSVSPDNPRVLSVSDPSAFFVGQTIRLNGAGVAAANLTARVDAISYDEVTIDRDVVTFPTSAGTGTISTSGTTLTGSGTAFLTQLQYRAWIVSGGNRRQVIKATTNTAGVLDTAFAANLSGASFTFIQILVDQLPSMTHGLTLGSGEVSPVVRVTRTPSAPATAIEDNTVTASPANIIRPRVFQRDLNSGDWEASAGSPVIGSAGGGRDFGWEIDASEGIATEFYVPTNGPARLFPIMYWTNDGAGSGDVAWTLTGRVSGDGEDTNVADAFSQTKTAAAPAQNIQKVTTFDPITVTPGKRVRLRLSRGADAIGNAMFFSLMYIGDTPG